jgi:hypothetical protein
MANIQPITAATAAAPPAGGVHAVIKAARTALPSHTLTGVPLRRFVSAVCSAEVEHARNDFWSIVHRMGAVGLFDRYRDPDCDAQFRLSHEVRAAAALNWLSHLQTHDSDRHGPWARWETMGYDGRCAWVRRRRYLLGGLIRAFQGYTAARAAYEGGVQ